MRSVLRSAKIKDSHSISRLAKELGVSRYFGEKSSRDKRLWRRDNYVALEMKVLVSSRAPTCQERKTCWRSIKRSTRGTFYMTTCIWCTASLPMRILPINVATVSLPVSDQCTATSNSSATAQWTFVFVHPPYSSIFVTGFNPEYGNTDLLIWLRKCSSP